MSRRRSGAQDDWETDDIGRWTPSSIKCQSIGYRHLKLQSLHLERLTTSTNPPSSLISNMVLKLYGSGNSTCTRRVGAVLREKKIPFELVEVQLMKGEHKSPAFMEKQPFGQIPYIDDDGFILYESRAICRYLEEKYHNQGPKLIPDDPKAKALFEQACSVETSNFDSLVAKAVAEKVFKPYLGQTPDQAVFDELIKQLGPRLDAYEKILSKQKYVAGDEFTLADVFHLPYGALLSVAGSDILTDPSRPNVARWWKDITGRDSWQAVKDGKVESNA
ncbi:putative GST superfamily protein [Lyophyllum shimeji]|uniref:glutathione transferase n=1 Tax=Lyophyllum shimeji TaxID=47721 RepID=A0A9P3Q2A2_LYOSH|nr:putative GST superfamily protein [Lyophyllum shimeji]